MSVKSKTQLETDIAADADLTSGQKTILTDVVHSYANTFPQVSTAQRNELTPTTGLLVFNTDTARYEYWNSAAWLPVGQNLSTPIMLKVDLSNEDLLDSGSVAVTLIAAPPSGYCILPIHIYARLNYLSEEFDFPAGSLAVVSNLNKEVYSKRFFGIDSDFLNADAIADSAAESNTAHTGKLAEADALVLLAVNGGPTQGNSSLTLYITYSLVEY